MTQVEAFDDTTLQQHYRYCLALTGCGPKAFELLKSAMASPAARTEKQGLADKIRLRRAMRKAVIRDTQNPSGLSPLPELTELKDAGDALKSAMEAEIGRESLLRSLDRLSPVERELLYLWGVEDWPTSEIGALLEVPRPLVDAHLKNALDKLRSGDA